MCSQRTWNTETAKQHYRISQWSMGHFDIHKNGNIVANTANSYVDLYRLSQELKNQDVNLPVLVRFPQILQQSLDDLCNSFDGAMRKQKYAGKYIAAYPIKVNQQATVIKHFLSQSKWPIALEAGSKAELIACLGVDTQQRTIICNGYKDESYIRLALMGMLLGHEIVIVLENHKELRYVLEQSELLNVHPKLGLRVRLSSIAKGNWQNTGGEYSKFGLTAKEVLSIIAKLKEKNVQHWLTMLHFHMGSQISNLQDIHKGMCEGMHYFAQLHENGVELEMLNIGGGLAVDYVGSKNDSYFSMNYSVQDYANVVIEAVLNSCNKHKLKMPTILSESGRALTAYHAVLISNVIDVEYSARVGNKTISLDEGKKHSKHLVALFELKMEIDHIVNSDDKSISLSGIVEKLKDILSQTHQAFSHGEMSLEDKAIAEKLTYEIYQCIIETPNDLHEKEIAEFEEKLVAKYFCNFSLFQSTPDIWGLKQIFPILPLHRLDERPTIQSRIYDLTCDSDGRIDQYIEADSVQPHLSLHNFRRDQVYVLGIFLVGAYQEILGDMHNLFGDTNAVNIVMNADGSYQICDEEPGDTTAEILSYLHIDTHGMRQIWLEQLAENHVNEKTQAHVIDELEASLNANSYLS